jgi:hypothetical protein
VHILHHKGGELHTYLRDCFERFNREVHTQDNLPGNEFLIDGIIISENLPEPKQRKLKWKPANLMTIDLYAYKLDKNILMQGYDPVY